MTNGFRTPEQEDAYMRRRAFGWEYAHTEPTGVIWMEFREHGYDYIRTLYRITIATDGEIQEAP